MKVVLDTNIILASFSPHSPYRLVFDKFEQSAFTLCLTSEILLEYEEKIGEIFNQRVAELTVGGLMLKSNVEKTGVFYQWRLIYPDLDDNKFVDCAFAASADYLVVVALSCRQFCRFFLPDTTLLLGHGEPAKLPRLALSQVKIICPNCR